MAADSTHRGRESIAALLGAAITRFSTVCGSAAAELLGRHDPSAHRAPSTGHRKEKVSIASRLESMHEKLTASRPEGPAIWVAGYSNVYSGYIPSRRVLLEGGYEARSRPWDPDLEERIVKKVHDIVGRLKVTPNERRKD